MIDAHVKRWTLAFVFASVSIAPAVAELPPQYTVWQSFAAITARPEIPERLGVVDRIERTGSGFRIFGGQCWIDATVTRAPPASSSDQPMVGPSRISAVTLAEKKCK